MLLSSALFVLLASAEAPLTDLQKRGREIYRHGTVAGISAGEASIGADAGVRMPASSFACANCHGIWGEGGRESGIEVPALHSRRLPVSAMRRAMRDGLNPAGKRLHAAMPRFDFPERHQDAVIAYLERIGDAGDLDPGVTRGVVRIGTALPLTGPLAAAGETVLETLKLKLDAEGDIFGRKLELVVEDTASTSAGLIDATRKLVGRRDVFALVANFEPADATGSAHRFLASAGVPLIGPIAPAPRSEDAPVFYLLPSLYDQARALVDFLANRGGPARKPRLAIAGGGEADAVNGVRDQARELGLEMDAGQPDYLIYCGDGRLLHDLHNPTDAPIAAFVSLAQSGLQSVPPKVRDRMLLVAPAMPPDSPAFFRILGSTKQPRAYPGLRTAAFAAGAVLTQALRACGSRLSREGLVQAMERMRDFETGVTAPLSFRVNRRNGSAGAAILTFQQSAGTFVPASGWINPKEAP